MESARKKEKKNEMFWRLIWPIVIIVIFAGAILISAGCGGGGGGSDGTKAENSDQNQNNNQNPPDQNTNPPADNNTTPPPDVSDATSPPDNSNTSVTPPDDTNTAPPPNDDVAETTPASAPKWWVSPVLKYARDYSVTGAYLQKENDTLWIGLCNNQTVKQILFYTRSINDQSANVGFKYRAVLQLENECNDGGIIVHDNTLYAIVNEVKYNTNTPWIAEKSTWKIYALDLGSGDQYAFTLKYSAEFPGMILGTPHKGITEFARLQNNVVYVAVNLKQRVEILQLNSVSKTFGVYSIFNAPAGYEIGTTHIAGRNNKLSMGVIINKPNVANESNTDYEHDLFWWNPESESLPAAKAIFIGTECCSAYARRLLHSRHFVLSEMVNLFPWFNQDGIHFVTDDNSDLARMGYRLETVPKGTSSIYMLNGDKALFAVWPSGAYGDSLDARRVDRLEEKVTINASPITPLESNYVRFYPVIFSDEKPVIVWDSYPMSRVIRFAVGTYQQ